ASCGSVVGVRVHGPAGGVLSYQRWFRNESFGLGEARSDSGSWNVPAGSAGGTYAIELAVYSQGWQTLFASASSVAAFAVMAATPGPTAIPGPTATPTAPPATGTPGASQTSAPTATPAPTATAPAATTPAATSSP